MGEFVILKGDFLKIKMKRSNFHELTSDVMSFLYSIQNAYGLTRHALVSSLFSPHSPACTAVWGWDQPGEFPRFLTCCLAAYAARRKEGFTYFWKKKQKKFGRNPIMHA